MHLFWERAVLAPLPLAAVAQCFSLSLNTLSRGTAAAADGLSLGQRQVCPGATASAPSDTGEASGSISRNPPL